MNQMKTKSLLVAVMSLLISAGAFAKNEKTVFNVSMHCEACQKKIEQNMVKEKGVKTVDVDLAQKTVAVTYDDTQTNTKNLEQAFTKLGYASSVAGENTADQKMGKECKMAKTDAKSADCCKAGQKATEEKCCKEAKACDKKDMATSEKKCDKKQDADKKCCKESTEAAK